MHCFSLLPPPGVTSFLLIFSLLIATWRSADCCTAEEFAPSSSTSSLPSQWLAFVDSLLMFSVLLLLSFSFSTSRVYLKVIGVYGVAWSNFGVLQLVVPCGTCPCHPKGKPGVLLLNLCQCFKCNECSLTVVTSMYVQVYLRIYLCM